MSLLNVDHRFSGLSPLPLGQVVSRLSTIGGGLEVREIRLIAHDESRTVMATISEITDVCQLKRIEVDIVAPSIPTKMNVWLFSESRRSAPGTIIDGLLYVGGFLAKSERPIDALTNFASACVQISLCLEVVFLVVADEDDASLQIQPGDLLLPSIFGMYKRALLEGVIDRLILNGAIVDGDRDPCYWFVWVAAPRTLMSGDAASRDVVEVLRHQLMSNPIPWSVKTRRFL